jgi:hypothetical protein
VQNKSIIATVIITFIAVQIKAQDIPESKVPKEVLKAFHENYPNIKKVQWEIEKLNYEAEYVSKQIKSSTLFDEHGNILSTEHAISTKALPLATQAYLKKNKLMSKIHDTNLITDAKKEIGYEVEINHRDYMFSHEGSLLEIIKN